MKKTIACLLFCLPILRLQAQREYLPTSGDLTRFHATTTCVVLNDNPLSDYNLEIRDAVEKFWSLTPYEFISREDFAARSLDANCSFLYLAAVSFEKDKTNARYMFLCLSLGGPDHETIDELKDITNLPLGYHGVDEDHYAYKLGTMVRFMQDHINLITENPGMVSQNVFQHYNDNMADLEGKTLYFVEDELAPEVGSVSRIREVYPYEVRIVDRETIKELIHSEDEDAVFLHKVGPEGKKLEARVYKILIGTADARFYYYDYHKATARNPDAFLESDFRRLARARNR